VGEWAKEDSAGRDVGAEGGAAGKTTEAASRTVEAGGETVGAWSAGNAVEEMDGAAGGELIERECGCGIVRPELGECCAGWGGSGGAAAGDGRGPPFDPRSSFPFYDGASRP